MNELEKQLETLLAEVKIYSAKPTKTSSGKIRKQLGEIKKQITPIRAELVAADKVGYK